jgi:hypothetical protein
MNQLAISADDVGAFLTGMLDVVFGFSLALERKGMLSRAEIVDTLTRVKDQVEAQEGESTKRGAVAELMLQAFAMPAAGAQARARLRLVDGQT